MAQSAVAGGVGLNASAQPARLRFARQAISTLQGQGLYFAPIRHHSPACARATRALIRQLRPAAILIEGPEEYTPLLADLQHPDTAPPLAVLSVHRDQGEAVSAFYPLADFSPEWVALREAGSTGIPAAFIDLGWDKQSHANEDATAEGFTRTLQRERYFAHSHTLAELARSQHCRDHDELWEQLFELRRPAAMDDWRTLFDEAFTWSALARLDYEPEVLLAEGTLPREALMLTRIEQWRERSAGPIVVVTGAFHTLALVEALAGAGEGGLVRQQVPARGFGLPPGPSDVPDNAWLVRYDLTRLDGLRGYGSGMPSPGFYQRLWESLDGALPPASVGTDCLLDISRETNEAGTSDLISFAEVVAATLQAERLADLRDRPWPGRTDVLDAAASCFARGETGAAPAVREAVATVFGGSRLGTLPATAAVPPIVTEARDRARALRLTIDDSLRRTVHLDVRRNPAARRRSRFLALMGFLDTGFATRMAGPDYITGMGLGRLREEWQYAWTPMVEARLIALLDDGASLHEAAGARITRAEQELASSPESRSAGRVAAILAQAALIGLDERSAELTARLEAMVEQDPQLSSVVAAGTRLLGLLRAKEVLELAHPKRLFALLERCLPQLAYLVDTLAAVPADQEEAAVGTLLDLRELASQVARSGIQVTVVREALSRLRTRRDVSPGVLGALVALAVVDGEAADNELGERLVAGFAPGADVGHAVRLLAGTMRAAPDLLLHTPELFEAFDAAINRLDPDAFLACLPDLRRSFSWLKPFETAALADLVAGRAGVAPTALTATSEIVTEADLRRGVALERQLRESLVDDQLLGWLP